MEKYSSSVILTRFVNLFNSVPWDLAVNEDIDDMVVSQWKDIFFAVVHDTVSQVCWQRRKMRGWLSENTMNSVRLKRLCYRKLKRLFLPTHQANLLCNKVCAATRFSFKAHMLILSSKIFIIGNRSSGAGCCNHTIIKMRLLPQTPPRAIYLANTSSVFTKEDISSLPSVPCYHFRMRDRLLIE